MLLGELRGAGAGEGPPAPCAAREALGGHLRSPGGRRSRGGLRGPAGGTFGTAGARSGRGGARGTGARRPRGSSRGARASPPGGSRAGPRGGPSSPRSSQPRRTPRLGPGTGPDPGVSPGAPRASRLGASRPVSPAHRGQSPGRTRAPLLPSTRRARGRGPTCAQGRRPRLRPATPLARAPHAHLERPVGAGAHECRAVAIHAAFTPSTIPANLANPDAILDAKELRARFRRTMLDLRIDSGARCAGRIAGYGGFGGERKTHRPAVSMRADAWNLQPPEALP